MLICNVTGQIWIAGARWPKNDDFEINKDETAAVTHSIDAFAPLIVPGSIIDLRIDNTFAEAGTKKRSIPVGRYVVGAR